MIIQYKNLCHYVPLIQQIASHAGGSTLVGCQSPLLGGDWHPEWESIPTWLHLGEPSIHKLQRDLKRYHHLALFAKMYKDFSSDQEESFLAKNNHFPFSKGTNLKKNKKKSLSSKYDHVSGTVALNLGPNQNCQIVHLYLND